MASAVNLDSLWGVWNDKTQPDTNRLKAIDTYIWGKFSYSKPDSLLYYSELQYNLAKAKENNHWMGAALNTKGLALHVLSRYDEAINCFNNSLSIFKQIENRKWSGVCLNSIGLIYLAKGNYQQALNYFKKSKNIFEEIGDKKNLGNTLTNIGIINKNKGNYKEAMLYYEKSLKVREEIGDSNEIAGSYTNIGNIYIRQENYEKALNYHLKSLQIGEKLNDKSSITIKYHNIGSIYHMQKKYDTALVYYQKSLDIEKEIGDKEGISSTYNNFGNLYYDKNNFKKALEYYHQSLTLSQDIGDIWGTTNTLGNIANIYFEQGNYQAALKHYKEALVLSKQINTLDLINYQYESLYNTYKSLGNHSKAIEMNELYLTTKDSLDKMNAKEEIYQFEIDKEYELKQQADSIKHDHDIEIQQEKTRAKEEELNNQKKVQNILFAGLGVISLLLLFAVNRFLVTRRQKTIIEQQKELVEEQKKDITDSIAYAENIQRALLPDAKQLSLIPDGFVLFQPKDIVSGDFYWMHHHNDVVYLAACDCTGHGVPGAFMSMIGSSQLDEAVVEKGLTQPNEIFYEVRKGFIDALKQTGEQGQQKDGMDAVLIKWDKKKKLEFAAAYNPLFLIRNGELLETKPDKQPVGFYTGEQKPFTHHELTLEKGDTVYIFSDGYHDQFGGPKDKKFMLKNFKKLLLSIQDKSMNEQKTILEETMDEWKGDTEQVDDILVIGVRF